MEMALFRAEPSAKLVVMMERPAGAVKAALTPLEESRRDQERPVIRETTQHGCDEEEAERDQEHAAASEQVRPSAAEQQEPAVAQDVRAHDPLQRAGGHAEVLADRRQGNTDHRDVERVEEKRTAQDEQSTPRTMGQAIGAALEGRRLEC
jgi:hypothetical protein